MTTDNDSVRADFQKQFPIPESCEWIEIYREYVWDETTTRHPHNDLWEAWQASRERYVPSPCEWLQDERDGSWDTSCGNKYEIIDGTPGDNEMKFCTYCGGHLLATPNGGNES